MTGLESPPLPARAGRLPCARGGVGRIPYRMHSVRPMDMPDVEGAIRTSKMTGRPCRWSSLRFLAPFLDVQRTASAGTALTCKEGNPDRASTGTAVNKECYSEWLAILGCLSSVTFLCPQACLSQTGQGFGPNFPNYGHHLHRGV
mgnify:CR=1 FL=1